jgi:hypothetical protein
VGVILVADPLQAWSPGKEISHQELANLSTPDGLPHGLTSKVIGIALVLMCALILGTESELLFMDRRIRTDTVAVVMRIIKDQASPSQINVVTSFCPAVLSALYVQTDHTVDHH